MGTMIEVSMEPFVMDHLVVLTRDHLHMDTQVMESLLENTTEHTVCIHYDELG
jgi:hypothetical protein